MDSYTKLIHYQKGFKYQLDRTYINNVGIKPEKNIDTMYISLKVDGSIIIKEGYAWDGPSGPTIDTDTFMRGSLEHDAIYQLIRMGLLPRSYRIKADERLYICCREDGMIWIRAQWVYRGVRVGGSSAANPENKRKTFSAP